MVHSAGGVCQDIEDQKRAEEVMAELVRLGVVRRTRDTPDGEEFALASAELLMRAGPASGNGWNERKTFREKAARWSQRKDGDQKQSPSNGRSEPCAAEEAFGVAFHKFSDWVEACWAETVRIPGDSRLRRDGPLRRGIRGGQVLPRQERGGVQARFPEAAAQQGANRKSGEKPACGRVRYCCSRVRHALRHSHILSTSSILDAGVLEVLTNMLRQVPQLDHEPLDPRRNPS